MADEQMNFDIVPPHLAVNAMRDNGYKNAGYALAELIDNSIQASARNVELLCSERSVQVVERVRRQVQRIAVLDDGCGMDATVLRMALQFGNGTHLNDRDGIGRFGMGLPSASISQCKRVDVWSWQGGVKNALYSYIDLGEVERQEMKQIPAPVPRQLPREWTKAANKVGKSGTLVVWSIIDRCTWTSANAIFKNSEFIIGRMYRRFLKDGRVSIRMASFLEDDPANPSSDQEVQLNDPMYLIVPSSCPAPYDKKQMFQKLPGDGWEYKKTIAYREQEHEVVCRFGYAREEARKGVNPGAEPYGRHAARNVGVSIVRADRELELSQAWVIQYDPVERWWGVEIEFPPALDELFGVANNKQSARILDEIANMETANLREDGKTLTQVREEMQEDGDPVALLLDFSSRIETNLRNVRNLLRVQTKGTRKQRHDGEGDITAEEHATNVTEERKKAGHRGVSDDDEGKPAKERMKELEEGLKENGLADEDASTLAARAIKDGLKYFFSTADIETPAFFSVKSKGSVLVITLNINHPAYRHLIEILDSDSVPENATAEDLRSRLKNSRDGLELLLCAWARYEDEQFEDERREETQDIRQDWGRMAKQFLRRDE